MRALPIAISMGEPAGIGPDLILQIYAQRQTRDIPVFIVYGNVEFLRARAERLGLMINIIPSNPESAKNDFKTSLPVFDMGVDIADQPAQPDANGAQLVIDTIAKAVADCQNGLCRAVVTAPLNKAELKKVGFKHPGHTEYLADLCAEQGNIPTPIMMLAHEGLRVVPLTIHVALARVPSMITREMIVENVMIIEKDLRSRFGIPSPRIALTGLNPHAGEDGAFGLEDREEITPAIADLKDLGVDASGPFPADTAFHLPNWNRFDVVVAMYHDQALIPIKTVAFDNAVNITLGLPIIRTSPDHGTAFDLAGKGNANTTSMRAAICVAKNLSTSL